MNLVAFFSLNYEYKSIFFIVFRTYLETMLRTYCKPCTSEEEDVVEAQTKAINEVVQELVRQLTQPNSCVRQQVR